MADNENADVVLEEELAADMTTAEEAVEDPEMDKLKRTMAEMESEKAKLSQIEEEFKSSLGAQVPTESKEEIDARSVYVGHVDFSAKPEELQVHFASCGAINRITILVDKFTQKPKGFAYVEFASADSVSNALALNESVFKGRVIKVTEKRTNKPGFYHGRLMTRGRGRGGYFQPRGGFRGHRRAYFAPY